MKTKSMKIERLKTRRKSREWEHTRERRVFTSTSGAAVLIPTTDAST